MATTITINKKMATTITIKTYLIPDSTGDQSGSITITSDAVSSPDTVSVSGTSSYNETEEETNYVTYKVIQDVRLDYISKIVFGDYNHIFELINANTHLGLEIFKDFFIPAGTVIRIPTTSEIKITDEINKSLPAWRIE